MMARKKKSLQKDPLILLISELSEEMTSDVQKTDYLDNLVPAPAAQLVDEFSTLCYDVHSASEDDPSLAYNLMLERGLKLQEKWRAMFPKEEKGVKQ